MSNPKRIIVTGASSGIGEALAEFYAAPGIFLALTGRNEERLATVAQSCREKGAEVVTSTVNVVDRDAMAAWLIGLDDDGAIDLVVANAGVGLTPKGFDALADATDQTFAVNVHGVFNTIHPLLDRMVKRGSGQLAINSSIASYMATPTALSYACSKAAVRNYGEGLRMAVKKRGVRVNIICPGFVTSRMTDQNKFKMPFLMTADRAARIIANGLARDKGIIAFPWQTSFTVRLFALLPLFIRERVLAKAPKKQEL